MTNQFKTSIAKEALYQLPLQKFQGKIILIQTHSQCRHVTNYLKNFSLLGFDTETKPSFRKGRKNRVALLQFSTGDEAFLFRLNKIGLPPDMIELLEDEGIQKVGAAIKDDLRHLRQLSHFTPGGFIELQEYVKEFGIENYSLKKLSGIVLNFRISKSQRLTNWELDELSDSQQVYAATDAWVCYEIYLRLRNSMTP